MCLFLSMVVWQPFRPYWRLIIARVSEMHVAYHIWKGIVGYLHQRNKQATTLRIFPNWISLRDVPLLTSFIYYISSISPCFLFLVTNYVQWWVFRMYVCMYVWRSEGKGMKWQHKEEWVLKPNPKCSSLTVFLLVLLVFKCRLLSKYVELVDKREFLGLKRLKNGVLSNSSNLWSPQKEGWEVGLNLKNEERKIQMWLYYDVLMSVVSLYSNGCIPKISVK